LTNHVLFGIIFSTEQIKFFRGEVVMYRVLKLMEELRQLKEICKRGEQNQYVIDRIFEIEMLLDNVYYTEF
jgi:hypothetical protein